MRLAFLVSLFVAAVFHPGVTSARELILAPSSKWVMSYDPKGCTLARSFGEGDDKVIVQFVKLDLSAGFEFNLKGKVLEKLRRSPLVGVRFGDTGPYPEKISTVIIPHDKNEPIAIRVGGRLDNYDFRIRSYGRLTRAERNKFRKVDPALEASISVASIKAGDLTISLQTGSLRAPMASLRKCTRELVASWGFDPQEMEDLALHPEPIESANYLLGTLGARRLYAQEQADINYVLKIDEKGSPTECRILSAVGKQSIIDEMCNNLKKRAHFWPAETKDGTKVPSYYVGGVLYLW